MIEFLIVNPPVVVAALIIEVAEVPLSAVAFVLKIFTLFKTTGLVDFDTTTESELSIIQLLILTLLTFKLIAFLAISIAAVLAEEAPLIVKLINVPVKSVVYLKIALFTITPSWLFPIIFKFLLIVNVPSLL